MNRIGVDHLGPQELRGSPGHLQRVAYLLALLAQRRLAEAERAREVVLGDVRSGGPVEQEVDLPERPYHAASPSRGPAARQRRRPLAGQLGHHVSGQPGVLLVKQVGAHLVGQLDDLFRCRPHRDRNAEVSQIRHGNALCHSQGGEVILLAHAGNQVRDD